MKAVRAEARKQIHANGQAVAAEHAGKAALIGHDGAVKHAVGALIAVARDHRVAGIAPYGRLQALRPVLPGDIGQGAAKNVCHTSTLAFLHKYYGKCCIKLRPAKGIPSRAAIKNRPRPAGRAGDGSPACPAPVTRAMRGLARDQGDYLPRKASICRCASAMISLRPSASISSYMVFTAVSGSTEPVSSSG